MATPAVTEEEERLRRAMVEQQMRSETQSAFKLPAPTQEEMMAQQMADQATAATQGNEMYRKYDKWRGGGLLGMGVAGLLNLNRDDKIQKRTDTAYGSLQKSRELKDMKAARLRESEANKLAQDTIEKFRAANRANTFTTSERMGDQRFKTREREAEQQFKVEEQFPVDLLKDSATEHYLDEKGGPVNIVRYKGDTYEMRGGEPIPIDVTNMTKLSDSAYAAMKKSQTGKQNVAELTNQMTNYMADLAYMGADIDPDRSAGDNLWSAVKTFAGPVGRALGTDESVAREGFNIAKPALINAIRQATDMSAKAMDSNTELQFYLSMMGGPGYSTENTMAAMAVINDMYGQELLGDGSAANEAGTLYVKEKKALRKKYQQQLGAYRAANKRASKVLEKITSRSELDRATQLELFKQTPAYKELMSENYRSFIDAKAASDKEDY